MDSSYLLSLAARTKMTVSDEGEVWAVRRDGVLDMVFKKRQFAKSIAETYADGKALRIAARQVSAEQSIAPRQEDIAYRDKRIIALELAIEEARIALTDIRRG